VTSREPLRLRGEQRFKTLPLEPAAAVELFVQRAQAINPDFALTPETGAIVAQICLQLDGLPLAIELAAARSELFTPHQLLEQLQHGRLDLLEAGARDLPERQRTLRTAIAWSYRLLSPAAQRLLRGLAVFVSGFDLESMQAVVGDEAIPTAELLSQLQTLVASSLVVAQEVAGSRRYLLLETIREYGWEQAALHQELHTLHSRHAAYFVQWTEAQVPRQFLREEGVWWQPLAREQENLRAALAWSLQCNGEQALRLAVALHPFWDTRGEQREGSRWLAQALALNPQPSLLRAQGLRKAGTFAQQRMDFQPAAQLLDEALAIFRMASDQDGEAETLRAWGWLAWTMSDALRAHECFAKSLSIFRQLDNRLMMATVLSNLVHVLSYSNAPYVQTRAYAEESLLIFRELGQQHGIALALRQRGIDELRVGNYGAAVTALTEAMEIWQRRGGQRELAWTREALGEAYWLLGHVATAASHWTESLTMFQTMDEEFGMMVVFHHLGQVERNHCQWARATHYYRLALHYFWKLDTPHFVARCLAGLGGVALAQGQPAHATQLLASAYQLFEHLPPFLAPGDQADYERLVEQARNALGEVEFCAAWETGARLNTEQAVQLGQRAEASE
jgi:tetratricopeptide (TPR) repeat protein